MRTPGQRLSKCLKQSGMTQTALAVEVGVHSTQISAWSRDVAKIPECHIDRLARVLGVSVEWLRDGTEADEKPEENVSLTKEDLKDIITEICAHLRREVSSIMVAATATNDLATRISQLPEDKQAALKTILEAFEG